MTRSTHSGARQFARLVGVVLVTLALVAAPAFGGAADPSPTIEEVTYTGDGNVSLSTDALLLWRSASHQFTVTVSTPTGIDAEVCLRLNATGRELGCERATVPANTSGSVAVGFDQWPANETGATELDVVLRRSNSSGPADERTLAVTVLLEDGDLDGDGLTSGREVSIGTDPRTPDSDDDGVADGAEVTTYDSSPVDADSDDDGLSDGAEIEMHLTNPVAADTDGDGLGDARELEIGASPYNRDSDGDAIPDAIEVNTYGTNATTADTDGDGLDDGAELDTHRTNPRNSDTDGDGISDALEVITYGTDTGDPDTDDDGLTDGAEVVDHQTEPATADTDGDGLNDGAEVNTYETNPLNADTDGDGLNDGAETNRYGTDPLAIDTDGDATSDRLEVQTGMFPDFQGPGLVAAGVLLVLTAATVGFFWTNGSLALLARMRAAGRAFVGRRREDPPEPNHVPSKPVSNEKRVLQVLDDHDGRVRQSDIVEETEWSKAKVSRVLSKMEDDGRVAKIDVGRENVVTRPEDVPEGANSPFET